MAASMGRSRQPPLGTGDTTKHVTPLKNGPLAGAFPAGQSVALSGKIASGKDSVGAALAGLFPTPAIRIPLAQALREECHALLDVIRDRELADRAKVTALVEEFAVPAAFATQYVLRLQHLSAAEADVYGRHPQIRWFLQEHGSSVRRAQAPDYWLKKWEEATAPQRASATSLYVPDIRYPNEVKLMRRLQIPVVRLDVSPAVQMARGRARDGVRFTATALDAPSEVALDGNEHQFDIRILNDGPLQETIMLITQYLQRHYSEQHVACSTGRSL